MVWDECLPWCVPNGLNRILTLFHPVAPCHSVQQLNVHHQISPSDIAAPGTVCSVVTSILTKLVQSPFAPWHRTPLQSHFEQHVRWVGTGRSWLGPHGCVTMMMMMMMRKETYALLFQVPRPSSPVGSLHFYGMSDEKRTSKVGT